MGKILSVDDSMTIRRIISGAVEMLGYDTLEAENGQAALDILETTYKEIDLILLDINMPVMDGFTTLDHIKSDERFKSIPVIMVTTESERSNIVRAIKSGAANYVCKPFTPEELSTKMAESLGFGLET